MTTDTALMLYGSTARGDSDPDSDVDVLAIADTPPTIADLSEFRDLATDLDRICITSYSWAEFEAMASYGSLFLHHLGAEGKLLRTSGDESRLLRILRFLRPYERVTQDVMSFRLTLSDVEDALHNDHSFVYEVSVVTTVLRHASILGCYMAGRPTFSRTDCMRIFLPAAGLHGADVRLATSAYSYRLCVSRGIKPQVSVTNEELQRLIAICYLVVSHIEELACVDG